MNLVELYRECHRAGVVSDSNWRLAQVLFRLLGESSPFAGDFAEELDAFKEISYAHDIGYVGYW